MPYHSTIGYVLSIAMSQCGAMRWMPVIRDPGRWRAAAAPSQSAYDLPPMGGIVKRRSKRIAVRRNARALLQGNY